MPEGRRFPPATKKEAGTSQTPLAISRSGCVRGSCVRLASTIRRRRRIASTATSDFPLQARSRSTSWKTSGTSVPVSFGFVLSLQLPENLLRFLHIFQRELAGFNQVCHDRLCAPAKQRQQVVD